MCQPLGRSEYCSRIRGTISSAGSGSVTVLTMNLIHTQKAVSVDARWSFSEWSALIGRLMKIHQGKVASNSPIG